MKRLRNKMIITVLLSVVSVFFIVCVVSYFALGYYHDKQADGMTKIISLNNGDVPKLEDYEQKNLKKMLSSPINFNEESSYRTRYFIVYLDSNGEPETADIKHIAAIDNSRALQMAEEALEQKEETGYIAAYRYRLAENENDQNIIVFLDCYDMFDFRNTALKIIAVIATVFSIMVTIIFVFCSKYILKPFEENSNRQKQFITDASHELKTPLAIISANAEVLQYKNGGNDWTQNIISQTERMGKLINELLTLSKLNESENISCMELFNYSELVQSTVESFKEVIEGKQVALQMEILPDLRVNGNKEQLTQMVSILIENAAKYVSENGEIAVSLNQKGKYAVLQVYNSAKTDANLDCEKLFDRFYRSDKARTSQTGGHGIGLSIAKRITEQQNGSISAHQQKDGICFVARISVKPALCSRRTRE